MNTRFRLDQRASGLLLHPTSLPGPHGSGDLGSAARQFVDFLTSAGQRWWQTLPIVPPGPGNSPYSSYSAFAGSPLLISLDRLAADGLLGAEDLEPLRGLRADRVSFSAVARFRLARLRKAFATFAERGGLRSSAFETFRVQQWAWLDDYAVFAALKRARRNQPWTQWTPDLRFRRAAALRAACAKLRREIEFEHFLQLQFHRQWGVLKKHANERGVGLIGDIPIFVAHDSADVWANRDLFQLQADGRPKVVSGVPPDLFSRTGQRWGHPHYRWARHRATGFAWWLARFRRSFEQFDAVRIDHFLGFNRCWAVPGRARTARRGRWIAAPGSELFQTVRRKLGRLEIIAEDLGLLTPAAAALRNRCGLPGMRVLHFAFSGDENHYHEPHAFPRNCVVYPGTHDNNTTVGWFQELHAAAKKRRGRHELCAYDRVLRYLGTSGRAIHWDMIRLAFMSVADLAIVPVQDLLGLPSQARMNRPATAKGNWQWRMTRGALTPKIAHRLRELAAAYDRLPEKRRGT